MTRCPKCGAELPAEASPGGLCPRCLLGLGLHGGVAGEDVATELLGAPSERQPGSSAPVLGTVGPYRLLEQIGEGGMGLVYLAEQETPIRRRVALKVIKVGMDTKEVIARFESERQALALMDHPNIAKVFDAGTTPGGRPYFVMEYVPGVPLTDYCDRHRLDVADRLALFTSVCKAVQHAHQKGIIHRDLKPGNVLVTVADGEPRPKVIDFGVAKAVSQRLTEKTLFTRHGALVGTPEYMSPEQAEMSGLDVDTRTDIYSLGVMLFELLTGVLPFDPERLRRAGYAEIQRIIREEEAPKPSTRVSTLAGATAAEVAARRQTQPPLLARGLRGDLDWVTLKALEKDRTRRYQSANELAADLERHRVHEPVSAGPGRLSGPQVRPAPPGVGGRGGFSARRARPRTGGEHRALPAGADGAARGAASFDRALRLEGYGSRGARRSLRGPSLVGAGAASRGGCDGAGGSSRSHRHDPERRAAADLAVEQHGGGEPGRIQPGWPAEG